MPFSMVCPNKGCGKQMDPYIDKSTDKVHCSICDGEIQNVTHFAKVQMKSLKQFKNSKNTTSFSVKCSKCAKESRPVISNKQVICPFCKNQHSHLSETFKLMLIDTLPNIKDS
jgi:ribosomal protein L34E